MHEKFHYKTLDEIKQTAAALGVALPFAADTHALAESLRVGKHVFPNRLGIAPMEGADSLRAATCVKRKAAVRSSGLRRSPLSRRGVPPRRSFICAARILTATSV